MNNLLGSDLKNFSEIKAIHTAEHDLDEDQTSMTIDEVGDIHQKCDKIKKNLNQITKVQTSSKIEVDPEVEARLKEYEEFVKQYSDEPICKFSTSELKDFEVHNVQVQIYSIVQADLETEKSKLQEEIESLTSKMDDLETNLKNNEKKLIESRNDLERHKDNKSKLEEKVNKLVSEEEAKKATQPTEEEGKGEHSQQEYIEASLGLELNQKNEAIAQKELVLTDVQKLSKELEEEITNFDKEESTFKELEKEKKDLENSLDEIKEEIAKLKESNEVLSDQKFKIQKSSEILLQQTFKKATTRLEEL